MQRASVTLKFVDGRQDPVMSWTCSVTVEIPLRTEKMGKISAERAAEMTAEIATDASTATMHSKPRWVTGLFCSTLIETMGKLFLKSYPKLGTRVKQ